MNLRTEVAAPTGAVQGHSPLQQWQAFRQRARRQIFQAAALSEERVPLWDELHVAWR
jgi:hypothetical protein